MPTVKKEDWQLSKGLVSYELKICKICDSVKSTIFFDGMGSSNICKDCKSRYLREKRKNKRKEWESERKCTVCELSFMPYTRLQTLCSPACGAKKWIGWKKYDPIKYRAFCMSNNLVGLKNKIEIVSELLLKAMGKPCVYCSKKIELSTASLDHLIPLERNKELTKDKEILLNQKDNLHIVCRKCNSIKSNFTDEEYKKIILFCKDNVTLGEKLIKRLARSNVMWGNRKKF